MLKFFKEWPLINGPISFYKQRGKYEHNHQPYRIFSRFWTNMVVNQFVTLTFTSCSNCSCSFHRLADIDYFVGYWHPSKSISASD